MSQKFTDWFPADVKPVNIGVYETKVMGGSGYQYWNGRRWSFWGFSVQDAYDCRRDISYFQDTKWRGLEVKP